MLKILCTDDITNNEVMKVAMTEPHLLKSIHMTKYNVIYFSNIVRAGRLQETVNGRKIGRNEEEGRQRSRGSERCGNWCG